MHATETVYVLLQSAKTNLNVEEVFFSIGRDIKQRLSETDTKTEVNDLIFNINCAFFFVANTSMPQLHRAKRC